MHSFKKPTLNSYIDSVNGYSIINYELSPQVILSSPLGPYHPDNSS
jgi:hypothetical protein